MLFRSYLANQFACPYQIINCVSSMTDLDLLGSPVLMGAETIWQDGPLPAIIRAANDHAKANPKAVVNAVVIVNEMNALTQNAQLAFNPLLDRQECIVLTQNNNELVKIGKDTHVLCMASMNPDVMGVNELQDAVRDRASGIIYMDYPPIDQEVQLIAKLTGFSETSVRPFVVTISECRKLKVIDHKITRAPSTRALLDWINYTPVWGSLIAFVVCIQNRYGTTEEERTLLGSTARGQKVETFSLGLPISPSVAAKGTSTVKIDPATKTATSPSPAKKAAVPEKDFSSLKDLGKLW